jgi:hypothetical protein
MKAKPYFFMQVGMFKWLYNILSLLEKQEQSGGG